MLLKVYDLHMQILRIYSTEEAKMNKEEQKEKWRDPLAEPVTEGKLTKKVEHVTAKVPSMGYLALAVGSMLISAGLATFSTRKNLANFVGLWVPTFMLMGIYNKLVKIHGSDQVE